MLLLWSFIFTKVIFRARQAANVRIPGYQYEKSLMESVQCSFTWISFKQFSTYFKSA